MDYNPARYQFGALSNILAEAFGEPGKRTFRLKMESGRLAKHCVGVSVA